MTVPPEQSPVGSLMFVGTATLLLELGPFRILTDPNFLHRGERAYLGYGLSSRRLTEPALDVAELPPLDAVVLSHLHGDHFDRVARRGLARDVPLFTTRHGALKLRRRFPEVAGMRTWQSRELHKGGSVLRVTALPGRHSNGPLRLALPPVMGSLLEYERVAGQVDLCLYITGDTMVFDGLREIPRRHPVIDVGVLHLGGTRILGRLVTMDGRRGVDLLEMITPRTAVPVHYDDYGVFTSPLSDFRREFERRRPTSRVRYLERGSRCSLWPGVGIRPD